MKERAYQWCVPIIIYFAQLPTTNENAHAHIRNIKARKTPLEFSFLHNA